MEFCKTDPAQRQKRMGLAKKKLEEGDNSRIPKVNASGNTVWLNYGRPEYEP